MPGGRTIKVGRIYQMRKGKGLIEFPFIRLSGKWLEQAGFIRGDLVQISASRGEIKLTPLRKRETAVGEQVQLL